MQQKQQHRRKGKETAAEQPERQQISEDSPCEKEQKGVRMPA